MRLIPASALGAALIFVATFVALQAESALGQPPSAETTTTVTIGDFWFCDPSFQGGTCNETTINVGDTVLWDYATDTGTAPHTTTECGDPCTLETAKDGNRLWDSGRSPIDWMNPGDTFSHTFEAPGTYLYLCAIHPGSMRGRVVVEGEAPTSTPTPTPVPTTAATRSPTPTPATSSSMPATTPTPMALGVTSAPDELPPGGSAPPGEEGGLFRWWHFAIGGSVLLALSGMALARSQRRTLP